MLTEEEKEHIRQEEIFRMELRNELNKKGDEKFLNSDWWKILNSSLGIVIISSVLFGGISWIYNKWQQSNLKENNNQEQIDKLVNEIEGRLDAFQTTIIEINNGMETSVPSSNEFYDPKAYSIEKIRAIDFEYKQAFIILKKPKGDSDFNIYPEYSNRPIYALLWELQYRTSSNNNGDIYESLSRMKAILYNERQVKSYNIDGKLKEGIINMVKDPDAFLKPENQGYRAQFTMLYNLSHKLTSYSQDILNQITILSSKIRNIRDKSTPTNKPKNPYFFFLF